MEKDNQTAMLNWQSGLECSEVVGYRCKICGQKVDLHGCSEHRQATDHDKWECIYSSELKKEIRNSSHA